jgi:hypothetical protein
VKNPAEISRLDADMTHRIAQEALHGKQDANQIKILQFLAQKFSQGSLNKLFDVYFGIFKDCATVDIQLIAEMSDLQTQDQNKILVIPLAEGTQFNLSKAEKPRRSSITGAQI